MSLVVIYRAYIDWYGFTGLRPVAMPDTTDPPFMTLLIIEELYPLIESSDEPMYASNNSAPTTANATHDPHILFFD